MKGISLSVLDICGGRIQDGHIPASTANSCCVSFSSARRSFRIIASRFTVHSSYDSFVAVINHSEGRIKQALKCLNTRNINASSRWMDHQPTSLTFVGRPFFQSTPTGIGGIHLTTGFRIGNCSFRGPVQKVCQCAERICGRGEAREPPRYSTEFDDDEYSRINLDTRTPTSHTCGSRGARTDPDNVLRAEGC